MIIKLLLKSRENLLVTLFIKVQETSHYIVAVEKVWVGNPYSLFLDPYSWLTLRSMKKAHTLPLICWHIGKILGLQNIYELLQVQAVGRSLNSFFFSAIILQCSDHLVIGQEERSRWNSKRTGIIKREIWEYDLL